MSTFEERSLTDIDGKLMRLYCRSCDQYFNGILGDKECQVCLGIVTPEYPPSDKEILDWMDDQFMVHISHHSRAHGQSEIGIPKRYNLRDEVAKLMNRLPPLPEQATTAEEER